MGSLKTPSLRTAFVLAGVFLGVLLGIELLMRAATSRPIDVLSPGREIYYFGSKPPLNAGPLGDLVPGRSIWVVNPQRPYAVVANRDGFRNDEDVDWPAWKILAVGGSFTFGPYVGNYDTWPALLEAQLRTLRPGTRIQVLNAGIAGYGIVQELSYLREKGVRLRPNLVILEFGSTDLTSAMRPDSVERFHRPEPEPVIRTLAKRSAALRWIDTTLRDIRLPQAAGDGDLANPQSAVAERYESQYGEHFAELAGLLAHQGVSFVTVAFPLYNQAAATSACTDQAQRAVESLAVRAGVPYLDLLPAFRQHRIEDTYLLEYDNRLAAKGSECFPDADRYTGNSHPSRFGNQVAARAMASWLNSAGLLPGRAAQ